MALEAIVSAVLEQLTSAAFQKIQEEFRLVGNVKKEVRGLTKNLQAIQAVLLDAEQRQMHEQSVKFWLDQLKEASYDIEDVLDDWNTAMITFQTEGDENSLISKKKVCFCFPTPCFGIKQIVLHHDIALRIKEIYENLDDIASQKDRYTFKEIRRIENAERVKSTSLVDVSEIFGREDEFNTLVSKLLCNSSESQQVLHIISIVGLGGIEKTTLAQLAYNNKEVISNFEKRMWVCVSDPFDEYRIAKAIIEALDGSHSELRELESLMQHIRGSITGQNFFLVLDDVWTEDHNKLEPFYHCLMNALHGSKILITTRNVSVARAHMVKPNDIITVKELSKKYSQLLFEKIAFFDRLNEDNYEELKEIGEKIVEKCKGMPLAIKTIGSVLRFKTNKEDWEFILNSEMWKIDEVGKGIFPPLLLSYYDLPPMVKSCFLYCATFPKDRYYNRNKLIYLWMAQGYLKSNEGKEMEKIGEEYFDMLVTRSLIINEVREYDGIINIQYKMHDIIHDVALYISQKECFTIEDDDHSKVPSIDDKIRHLMFVSHVQNRSPFPLNIPNPKKLRSLLFMDVVRYGPVDEVPRTVPAKFFDQLTYLKALKLGLNHIEEIPEEIGKLIYLKFLELYPCDRLGKLPESLWELYNLQTLILGSGIKRLSGKVEKLINLRHLMTWRQPLDPTPKQIDRLTCLQSLNKFVVGDGNLECLKNLNKLRGHLRIENLRNATDANEVKKAEFKKKKEVISLGLMFENPGSLIDRKMLEYKKHDEKLLEALEPPPKLEFLCLSSYRGSFELPNWMMSLKTLKKLELCHCYNWECLPPLGKWPFLESLSIFDMVNIERVSKEFLGIKNGGASSSFSGVILFPKLKHLKFVRLLKWKKWDYGITKEDEEHITIMPCLCSLTFVGNGYLEELPEDLLQRTTLEKLRVEDSGPYLQEQYDKWKTQRVGPGSSSTN